MIFTNQLPEYSKYDIGDYTYGKPRFLRWDEDAYSSIGKFCSIAANVKIFEGGNHCLNYISTYPFSLVSSIDSINKNKDYRFSKGPVKIGNDVWIGMDTTILSGVTIGSGAVIAAASVVTKDVKPYEVVGGNPAKHIKFRFDEKQIQALLAISWWDWELDRIKSNMHLIRSADIDKFIYSNMQEVRPSLIRLLFQRVARLF